MRTSSLRDRPAPTNGRATPAPAAATVAGGGAGGGARLLAGATLLGALGLLFWLRGHPHQAGPPCPLNHFTGLFCPGCGTFRALRALAGGRLLAAFAWNPLLLILLPTGGYVVASLSLFTARGRGLSPRVPAKLGWAILVLIITFGVARNLPFFPFDRLRPGALPIAKAPLRAGSEP